MRVVFVEQPGNLPAPPAEGRVAVVDVAFAGGENFETSTLPFLEALGDRLAIWIDHHEHPLGWARFRDDPRFLLVPNQQAHACPELVTPEVVRKAGKVDVVVAHADFDGLVSAVKFLRGGEPPWPEADEDARAADSPGRGHAYSARARLLAEALDHAQSEFRTAQREALRQEIAAALVQGGELPPALKARVEELARAHEDALRPVEALALGAREEAGGVLVVRVVTAATFREGVDLSLCDELTAGRSDYRFAQADDGGRTIIARLGALVRTALT